MHADRFANIVRAGAVQAERDARLIEMSIETRRCLERADVKLVWVKALLEELAQTTASRLKKRSETLA
jgi:hypothetical protein